MTLAVKNVAIGLVGAFVLAMIVVGTAVLNAPRNVTLAAGQLAPVEPLRPMARPQSVTPASLAAPGAKFLSVGADSPDRTEDMATEAVPPLPQDSEVPGADNTEVQLAMAPTEATTSPKPRPVFDDGTAANAALDLLVAQPIPGIRPVPRPAERPVTRADAGPAPIGALPKGPSGLTTAETARRAAQGPKVAAMIAKVRADDWAEARAIASGIGPVAEDIVQWRYLRAGLGTFDEVRQFLDRRADWPGLDRIRYRNEDAVPTQGRPADVLAHFAGRKPFTGAGAVAYINALKASGQGDAARAEAVRAWTTLSFNPQAEAAILADWSDTLRPHHAARIDMLLWRGMRSEAQRIILRVDEGEQRLAQARMTLRARGKGPDAAVAAVPDNLRDHPGLAYERFSWRIAKGLRDSAAELILSQSKSREALGQPERWARQRRDLVRRAMRAGKTDTAYRLASQHWLTEGSDYADLEWLSGYLSLRFRRDPGKALEHFKNFRGAVFTPISLGRAGYWEGRAYEALGNTEAAQAAYRRGGAWQTGFYGQLAAEKAGLAIRPELTGSGGPGDWRNAPFVNSSVTAAARLFIAADEHQLAAQFLSHLVEEMDATEATLLGDMALELGAPHAALKLAKEAAQRGIVLPRAYFPVVDLDAGQMPVERALALSIARRESEFNPGVSSGAGARGMMQVMPATSRIVARDIGLPYSKDRLLTDPSYNARLGTAYLAQLEDRFGENVLLVSAGYNAGPGRPERWMRERGDPRNASVDAVDWIEMIPFDETRNYAMRVAESIPVYRARISGKVVPIDTSASLKAR